MNKNSNKSKLSKKLKFISVASAITICVVTSTGGTETSASMFRNGWNRITSWFSQRFSNSTSTGGSGLNRPASNARTSSSTTGGSSIWSRIKRPFTSNSSNNTTTNQNSTTVNADDINTTNQSPGTPQQNLWGRVKKLFTGNSGSNTSNKSGVKNEGFELGELGSSSNASSQDGIQYASLDFTGKSSSNTVHGSGNETIYAQIQPTTSGTTGSSSSSGSGGGRRPIPTPRTKISGNLQTSSSGSSGDGRRPIPAPRKNLSSSLQTSSTGSNDGNNGGNTTGVLTSKTQSSSNDSQSSSSNSTGPVIVGQGYGFINLVDGDDLIIQTVAPPTPVKPKGLGQTNYISRGGSNTTTSTSLTSTGGDSSSSIGPSDQTPPRGSLIPRTYSTVTIGGSSTSSNTGGNGDSTLKLVTFKLK